MVIKLLPLAVKLDVLVFHPRLNQSHEHIGQVLVELNLLMGNGTPTAVRNVVVGVLNLTLD